MTLLLALPIILTALLGLIMGSFLNCFAYRYAGGESVHKGRSHCAQCGHVLAPIDLIPVISFLMLGGKCRYCKEKLSPSYVLAELICSVAYVSVFLKFGFGLAALKFFIFISLLFAAAFTDAYCRLIPDRLIIIGIVTALGFSFFMQEGVFLALGKTILNGLSISLPLLLITLAFEKATQREAMGGGDIKLMFMIGLFFDWRLNLLIIILACFIGIVYAVAAKRLSSTVGSENLFAFGPALCTAAWIAMLWGQGIMDWYLAFF